tara:strand:+ start:64 stop:603 length:540 start_codon:yes stop_codon:yes gene_type:complete
MINYNNTIIYKIYCKDKNIKEVYIGSTTNFTQRKNGHKTKCTNPKDRYHNQYKYKFIRENGGWDNWIMEILEKVNCKDKKEKHFNERKWYDKFTLTLNSDVPNRDNKEWKKDNRDRINKLRREWYKKNSHKNKEYFQKNKHKLKRYKKVICECGFETMFQNLKRHQESSNHTNLMKKLN